MILNVWEHLRFPSSKRSMFLLGEICAILQRILLVFAPIGANSFKFQDGKLYFEAVFCWFCKNTSTSKEEAFAFLDKRLFQKVFLQSQEQYCLGEKISDKISQENQQSLDFWKREVLKNM